MKAGQWEGLTRWTPVPRVDQAFGVNSTSHLHLQKIEVGWIFTLFSFWLAVNLHRTSLWGMNESLPNHANCIRQSCESSPKNMNRGWRWILNGNKLHRRVNLWPNWFYQWRWMVGANLVPSEFHDKRWIKTSNSLGQGRVKIPIDGCIRYFEDIGYAIDKQFWLVVFALWEYVPEEEYRPP